MSETRVMYMHTLDGRLARWNPVAKQIVDAGTPPLPPIPVYRSLRTLKDHVARSTWGQRKPTHVYGWLEVEVPR